MTQQHTNESEQEKKENNAHIRIYVACLAAYNNAILHGTWIDATQDPDDIMEDVQSMLKASPIPNAEEWAIHDYEGFHGIILSEWESFEQVHAIASFVEEYGELGAELYSYSNDLEEAREALCDRYVGSHSSLADFAQDLTEDTTTIPKNLAFYIDYYRMARDMEMSGDIFAIETAHEVHIFWSR